MTAWMYTLMPLTSLMTLVSMCQTSFGPGRPHPDGGVWRIQALARPAPAAFADELGPRGDGGEHAADALGVHGQSAERYLAVVRAEDPCP